MYKQAYTQIKDHFEQTGEVPDSSHQMLTEAEPMVTKRRGFVSRPCGFVQEIFDDVEFSTPAGSTISPSQLKTERFSSFGDEREFAFGDDAVIDIEERAVPLLQHHAS